MSKLMSEVRWTVPLLMLLMVTVEADAADLNPPYGDPVYRPFSLFDPSPSADTMRPAVVVFHGLLSAVPNGTFKRLFKKLRKTHWVVGINYDALDVDVTLAFLDETLTPALSGRRVSVVGTSMGGYWAWMYGHQIGASRIILLNPVTKPHEQLQKHIGKTRRNVRRQVDYTLTATVADAYGALDWTPGTVARQLVFLTRDDDVLDYRTAEHLLASAPNTRLEIYDRGGHTINLKNHPALDLIAEFVAGD